MSDASDVDLELSRVDGDGGKLAGIGSADEASSAEEGTAFVASNPVASTDQSSATRSNIVQEKLRDVLLEGPAEGREVEIKRLLAEGANVNHRYGILLDSPLHLLCYSFSKVKDNEDMFRPFAASTLYIAMRIFVGDVESAPIECLFYALLSKTCLATFCCCSVWSSSRCWS